MTYQDFIIPTLNTATQIAKDKFGKVSGSIKPEDPNQVLTEADLAIGKFIVSEIQRDYPDHNVIDEEAGIVDRGSEYTWVIDPIDGTSNFVKGLPTYGIMIGLLHKDKAIVGGVSLPAFDEIYYAEKGKGAFCNNEKISVNPKTKLKSTLIAYGIDGHPESPELTREEGKILAEILLKFFNLRTSNSVFDAMMLAKGKYTALLNRTSKIWDNVAEQIIIEEAGGLYTDFYGKPIDYRNPVDKIGVNYGYCSASPEIHQQLQAIIHNA